MPAADSVGTCRFIALISECDTLVVSREALPVTAEGQSRCVVLVDQIAVQIDESHTSVKQLSVPTSFSPST